MFSLRQQDGTLPRYRFPWALDPSRWKTTTNLLASTRVQSPEDLTALMTGIAAVGNNNDDVEAKDFVNLVTAISELEEELEGFQFYKDLLPLLQRDVVSAPEILGESCAVLFQECKEAKVQFTHHQAYRVACLAFFGLCHPLSEQYHNTTNNNKDTPNVQGLARARFGHLDWSKVYRRGGSVAVARIKCQLTYLKSSALRQQRSPENDTYLTFYRTVLTSGPKSQYQCNSEPRWTEPDWAASQIPLSRLKVNIAKDQTIEDVKADAHLDFANKYLHIGCIIPSATQEEVLFSIRPECFVGLLFLEMMQENEAIIITGARRFCNYSGYLKTFRCTGPHRHNDNNNHPEPNPPAIIAIDALVNSIDDNQFHPDRMTRDLNKAYLGFAGVRVSLTSHAGHLTFQTISTGQWGCGAFMGDPVLKFLQQVLAAANAGVGEIHYSAFQNPVLAEELEKIWRGLVKRDIMVGSLYQFVISLEDGKKNVAGRLLLSLAGTSSESPVTRFHRELKELAGVE